MATPEGVDPAAWAALLRWSMKQNSSGYEGAEEERPTPKPMTKEDRAWLESVMKGKIVFVILLIPFYAFLSIVHLLQNSLIAFTIFIM